MEGKQIWMTIIVALVVAAVTSLVTGAIAKDVLLAPYTTTIGQGGPIRANSCDADETCEVTAISSAGTITTNTLKSQGNMLVTSNEGGLILSPDRGVSITEAPNYGSTLYVNQIKQYNADQNGNLLLDLGGDEGTIYVHGIVKAYGPVQIGNLSSNGDFYVCANRDGLLFSSPTPCV